MKSNLRIIIFLIFISIGLLAQEKEISNSTNNTINDITVKDMNGNDINLSDYNEIVLLIVNVASECGYTPQYEGLQEIYKKYNNQGFEILAFPCNDFGAQEPGTNEDIKEFCSLNYGITFQLFDKIKILGEDKSPLYKRLSDNEVTGTSDVKWNFEKFLISKKGEIIQRFRSKIVPTSEELIYVIDRELNKKNK